MNVAIKLKTEISSLSKLLHLKTNIDPKNRLKKFLFFEYEIG